MHYEDYSKCLKEKKNATPRTLLAQAVLGEEWARATSLKLLLWYAVLGSVVLRFAELS